MKPHKALDLPLNKRDQFSGFQRPEASFFQPQFLQGVFPRLSPLTGSPVAQHQPVHPEPDSGPAGPGSRGREAPGQTPELAETCLSPLCFQMPSKVLFFFPIGKGKKQHFEPPSLFRRPEQLGLRNKNRSTEDIFHHPKEPDQPSRDRSLFGKRLGGDQIWRGVTCRNLEI